jgi:hypothetical protein
VREWVVCVIYGMYEFVSTPCAHLCALDGRCV